MGFDRSLWVEIFAKDEFPKFRCPKCAQGHLNIDEATLSIREPNYSRTDAKHEDWEPHWMTERFIGVLTCDRGNCGEVVTVSGDTTLVEDFDEEIGWGLLTVLRPQALFPAPPIIDRPKEMPVEVDRELIKSFQLFWIDLNACANRLRVSVERLLDHFQVPRETLSKKVNKSERLDLNGRISIFEKQDADTAKTLTALRMIGNLGSHGDNVSRKVLLDAYEVYEDCLFEVFGKRKQRLEAIRQKIIQAKGKY